jgi:hypothetical protein
MATIIDLNPQLRKANNVAAEKPKAKPAPKKKPAAKKKDK